MKTDRIDWLDAAKGISIILVVLYHTTRFAEGLDIASYGFVQLNNLLKPIRMPLFFAVSGYLASASIQRDWQALLTKKVVQFLYLFALWTVLTWIYFVHLHPSIGEIRPDADAWWLLSNFYAPETAMWFVWALMLYFILGKALYRIRRFVFPWTVLLSILANGFVLPLDNFAQVNLFRYAPFFFACAWFGRGLLEFLHARAIVCIVVGGLTYAAFAAASLPRGTISSGVVELAASICGLTLGAGISIFVAEFRLSRSVASFFGRRTLPIYVAHVILAAFLCDLVSEFGSHLPFARYWAVPVITLTAVAGSLGLQSIALRVGIRWLYTPPMMRRRSVDQFVSVAPSRSNDHRRS